MFRAMFLPIIRSTWTVFTLSGSVYLSCCRHQPEATWVNTTRYCKYSPSAPDDGQRHRPKHVQPTWNNKLIYIVHFVDYFHSYTDIIFVFKQDVSDAGSASVFGQGQHIVWWVP
jgi:hypothetical protein